MHNKSRSLILFTSIVICLLLIVLVSAQNIDKKFSLPLTPEEIISHFESGKISERDLAGYADEGKFEDFGKFQKAASEDFSLEIDRAWGGPVDAVHIDGNIAYVGSGQRLVILDISDLKNVQELGNVHFITTIQDIVVRDGYAYVVTLEQPNIFSIVDVSDVFHPEIVGDFSGVTYPGWPVPRYNQISLYSHYAILLDEQSSAVHAFDISNPYNPDFLGCILGSEPNPGCTYSNNRPRDIEIVDDTLYLASGRFQGFGDPDAVLSLVPPKLVAYKLAEQHILNPVYLDHVLFINENDAHMYLATENDRLAITIRYGSEDNYLGLLDISNPSNLLVEDSFSSADLFAALLDIDMYEGFIYLAHDFTIDVYSISDLTSPVSSYSSRAVVRSAKVENNRAYLFDQAKGLVILDTSNPLKLEQIGSYHSPTHLRKATRHGNFLFVPDKFTGFTVLDISDSSHDPEVVSFYQSTLHEDPKISPENFGIAVNEEGTLVYLTTGFMGLEVIDISDIENPHLVGSYRPEIPFLYEGLGFEGLTVKGNTAYVGFEDYVQIDVPWHFATPNTLLNLDISDPTNIVALGSAADYEGSHEPQVIVLNSKDIAFVARDSWQITFDTSDVSNPYLVYDAWSYVNGTYIVDPGYISPMTDIALEGDDILYIADGEASKDGLIIQDVSDPADPSTISQIDVERPNAVAFQKNRLYTIGNGCDKFFLCDYLLMAFDVSDPLNVELIGSAPVGTGVGAGDTARSYLYVEEPYIYVSTGASGDGGSYPKDQGLIIVKANISMPEDLNGDGFVDGLDLGILLGEWGFCKFKGVCPPDFNGDNTVNGLDLAILLAAWTPSSK